MKVVINSCFGGFGLSPEAVLHYLKLAGKAVWPEQNKEYSILGDTYWLVPPGPNRVKESGEHWHELSTEQKKAHNKKWKEQVFYYMDLKRDDPLLVQTVEELGSEAASGFCAQLQIVEIPDGVNWGISEYDGIEHIAESHRTWP